MSSTTLPPNPPLRSIFVDSSVLFAASYSSRGSAHDLILAALRGTIEIVLSRYVLEETERNLRMSAPQALAPFERFRQALPYTSSAPDAALVSDTARLIVAKDAPIIAAARAANVDLVATYDRRDLLSKRDAIIAAFGITVATPEELLHLIDNR